MPPAPGLVGSSSLGGGGTVASGTSSSSSRPLGGLSSSSSSTQWIVVIDNGGGYIRAGLASDVRPVITEPNCVAVPAGSSGKRRGSNPEDTNFLFGEEVRSTPSYALHRASKRGVVLDFELQGLLWTRLLAERLEVPLRRASVLVTETPLTPGFIKEEAESVLLGTLKCKEVCVISGPPLALYSPVIAKQLDLSNPCCLVLSLGFSSCLAVPCIEKRALDHAIRRLNVGGRVLTNLLLEHLKARHYDLSKSWLVAEDMLMQTSEISADFTYDIATNFERVKEKVFVLPDFEDNLRGYVETQKANAPLPPSLSTPIKSELDPETPAALQAAAAPAAPASSASGASSSTQIRGSSSSNDTGNGRVAEATTTPTPAGIAGKKGNGARKTAKENQPDEDLNRVRLRAECVAIPEALFSPADHGISHQGGLTDLVIEAIQAVDKEEAVRLPFCQIVLCGALAKLPGLRERLSRELRQELPSHWPLRIIQEPEPENSVWRGAAALARDPAFRTNTFRTKRAWDKESMAAASGANSLGKRPRRNAG